MTRMSPALALLWVVRATTVIAALLGILTWQGLGVPVHAHMAAGGVMVLSAWGVAILAPGRARGQSFLLLLIAILVPILGMAQLHHTENEMIIRLLHVAVAVGSAALAEMRFKRGRS